MAKDEIKITRLKEGEAIFESNGISNVKITKDGKVKTLVFSIRSTGVAELIDKYAERAPRPPVKNELVQADSWMGRQMKLGKKQWVKILDTTDPDYVAAKEKHDQDLGMAIMLQGLDVELMDKNDKPVTDGEQQVKILKSLGMTTAQFMQIVRDIQDLTEWAERQETSFFDES